MAGWLYQTFASLTVGTAVLVVQIRPQVVDLFEPAAPGKRLPRHRNLSLCGRSVRPGIPLPLTSAHSPGERRARGDLKPLTPAGKRRSQWGWNVRPGIPLPLTSAYPPSLRPLASAGRSLRGWHLDRNRRPCIPLRLASDARASSRGGVLPRTIAAVFTPSSSGRALMRPRRRLRRSWPEQHGAEGAGLCCGTAVAARADQIRSV